MPQPERKKTDRDETLLAEILLNYDIGELNHASTTKPGETGSWWS